jgi:hypothetical protein
MESMMAHFEDEYAGTDAKFEYAHKRTHPMRQGRLPQMPWHTDDKPFGMTQEEYEDLIEEAVTHVEPTNQTDGTVQDEPERPEEGKTHPNTGTIERSGSTRTTSTGILVRSGAGAGGTQNVLGYCFCGMKGKYKLDRWYCEECWEAGDDEDM